MTEGISGIERHWKEVEETQRALKLSRYRVLERELQSLCSELWPAAVGTATHTIRTAGSETIFAVADSTWVGSA